MNRRASIAFVVLCLLGASIVVVTIPAMGAIRGQSCGVPGATPRETLELFVKHALERKGATKSYELVTPELRRGASCEQWAKRLPIKPFRDVKGVAWHGFSEGQDTGKIVAYVALTDRGGKSALFVMELTLGLDQLWRVSHWAPTGSTSLAPEFFAVA